MSFEVGRDPYTVEDNKKVAVRATTLAALLEKYHFLRPVRIFDALGGVIDKYVENRKRLLREAEELQRESKMEEELLGHFVDRN